MTNLFQANHQWTTRPDDERFESLQSMYVACKGYADSSITSQPIPFSAIRAEAMDGEVLLVGKTGRRARLTHFAFGQLAKSASSPAEFIRQLPATLASQVLNNRLKSIADEKDKSDLRILFHENGSLIARSITSELYDRTWNHEVIRIGLMPLAEEGWRVPPARPCRAGQHGTRKATAADILPNQGDFGLSVKEGDEIAPAGLYASDHDMFAFLVNPERSISIGKRSLMRGLFVRNSEVGDGALVLDWFDLDNVCGNHICWGVENRRQIRVKHITGKGRQGMGDTLGRAMAKFEIECRKLQDSDLQREQQIVRAQKLELGATKEEVIEAIFTYARGKNLPALTRKTLEAGYELAEQHEDWYGSPRTAFGLVSGLTEHSQSIPYTDRRHEIDAQAGRLLTIAF